MHLLTINCNNNLCVKGGCGGGDTCDHREVHMTSTPPYNKISAPPSVMGSKHISLAIAPAVPAVPAVSAVPAVPAALPAWVANAVRYAALDARGGGSLRSSFRLTNRSRSRSRSRSSSGSPGDYGFQAQRSDDEGQSDRDEAF